MVNFISLENLIRSKTSAGRTQDKLDLENLQEQGTPGIKAPIPRKIEKR